MKAAKTRILLTGACGAVGKELLPKLCGNPGYEVIAFDLPTPANQKLLRRYQHKATILYGDLRQPDDLSKLPAGINAVLHLGAIIPPTADRNPKLAQAVNVDGTANLIDELEHSSPDAFLIYASSVSVYGDRVSSPMIRATDPLRPVAEDHYAHTKVAAENLVMESSLSWTIFRLSAIMGYGNHKPDAIMFEMPLKTALEFTTPQDTATAFSRAIEARNMLSGRVFNLGGGEKCRTSYENFLKRSFEVMGLGEIQFPPRAFAEKNYHCGYYADSDILEDILHFQHDTTETYFQKLKASVPGWKRFFTSALRTPVRLHLLRLSEPYKAYKRKDHTQMRRFFNGLNPG